VRLKLYDPEDKIPSLSTEGSARNSDSKRFDDGRQFKELITSSVRWVDFSNPGGRRNRTSLSPTSVGHSHQPLLIIKSCMLLLIRIVDLHVLGG
jgi:hypothetical protein